MLRDKRFGILPILCVLLLCGALCSCGRVETPTSGATEAPEVKEPESAEQIWEKVDEVMSAVKSYEYKSTMQLTYYYMGMRCDVSSIGNGVRCELEDDYYEYSDDRTDMRCDELSAEETRQSVEAYSDGKMYISNTVGDAAQRFCSPITYEEYGEESESLLDQFDVLDCKDKSFVKGEDGGYTLSFSGYTKKAVRDFLDGGMSEDDFGADILDLEISITVDAEFHAKVFTINVVFDVDEDDTLAPVMTMESTYSGFGTTEPNYDQLKTEEYTEIDDVRILDDVSECLDDFLSAKSGEFVVDSSQTISVMGEEDVYREKDEVSFSEENGGFIYDVAIESSDGDGNVSYKNGTQDVVYAGEEYSQAQTDAEAREFIDSLLEVEYDSVRVSGIEVGEDGTYIFTVEHPDGSYYESYFESIGVEYTSMTQTFTVTMDGEELRKISNDTVVYGVYNDVASTEPVEMKIHMSVDFTNMHK
ncbi:MAG: hypothetical protein IJ519_02470, partial [Clostridia bacterium]|nr:hypothetical protein [Clostridia bacterium]